MLPSGPLRVLFRIMQDGDSHYAPPSDISAGAMLVQPDTHKRTGPTHINPNAYPDTHKTSDDGHT